MSIISIIFAMDANRTIGNNGNLPWHLPSDLQRFRSLTAERPIIMGRKTFESILARNGKPLPGRPNIVVTRAADTWNGKLADHPDMYHDCFFVSSLHDGIRLAQSDSEIFVIGGAEIYAQALPLAERMYFTQVGGTFDGDTKFPLFNKHDWETVHDETVLTDNCPYAFSYMKRIKARAKSATTTGDNLVNPLFAQHDGYDASIADIAQRGVCPFCTETFLWHPWPILHRIGDWVITRSGWPYKNAEHHFLIIGDRHINSITNMTPSDHSKVNALVAWATWRFDLKGYGVLSRSGDTNYTGSSVQHLHFHLIQPKLDSNGKACPVFFPIG